jgi:DNA modification methylase
VPTLNWIGKEAVVEHHRQVPTRLLECDPKLSVGDPEAENLLVEGDNLEALKALLPRYRGQVKCIYIDPPYNTGNEGWVYNDNVTDPRIKKWLGQVVGKEAEDLCRHDKWLCMMYPRLALLREFLREDGVLFVSIDENEKSNLVAILDELYGASNRVGVVVWKNATDNNPSRIVIEHEYVVCYAREKPRCEPVWKAATLDTKQRLLEVEAEFIEKYSDTKERQQKYTGWFSKNKPFLWPFQDYKFIDNDGIYTGMRSVHNPGKEGYRYDVIHPGTKKPCAEPLMGYRFPPETMDDLLAKDRILFGKDHTKVVELKVYAKDYRAKLSSLFELDGRRGTNELKAIFPESKRPFDFPKSVGLIEEVLAFVTSGNDIVLDSFSGSGTTGHAVLSANGSDGGTRKCILVELDPKIAREVTRERLGRLCSGYVNKKGEPIQALGSGFRYCQLGRTLLDEQGSINGEVPFTDLARYVYLLETGVPVPKRPRKDCPLLGVHRGRAIYLLYNGVLGDRRPQGGNVLTRAVLRSLPPHPDHDAAPTYDGPPSPSNEGRAEGSTGSEARHTMSRVIYGEACRLSDATLDGEGIVFRQIPYALKEA